MAKLLLTARPGTLPTRSNRRLISLRTKLHGCAPSTRRQTLRRSRWRRRLAPRQCSCSAIVTAKRSRTTRLSAKPFGCSMSIGPAKSTSRKWMFPPRPKPTRTEVSISNYRRGKCCFVGTRDYSAPSRMLRRKRPYPIRSQKRSGTYHPCPACALVPAFLRTHSNVIA
jgi:hypothetical protein